MWVQRRISGIVCAGTMHATCLTPPNFVLGTSRRLLHSRTEFRLLNSNAILKLPPGAPSRRSLCKSFGAQRRTKTDSQSDERSELRLGKPVTRSQSKLRNQEV